ncbi:MAG: sulfite exporter TauE/SafE family protein, partial [Chloroflexi bacterium]|nr:sulfite exporter TauE/SafE family protein [Chloroflexota bacterium]
GSELGSRRLGTPVMRGLLAVVLLVAGLKLILVG